MKIWKIMILVCGLAGLAGFFLPITKSAGDASGKGAMSFSALDVMRGGGDAGAVVQEVKDVGKEYAVSKDLTIKAEAKVGTTGVMALKGIVAILFVPSFFLVVLGLAGVFRGRFGRLGAIGAIVFGLASAAMWGVFFLGASSDAAFKIGLGLHMLLVAGLGGIIGGIGNFVKPDGDKWSGV